MESVSSFPTQKCLRRAILPSDLTRFPSYTHRIRQIQFDAGYFVDVEVIQALTMATLHMRPLFPNVKHLVWHYGDIAKEVERSLLQCIHLFCAPKLATLDIFLRNSFDTTCLSIFSDLINYCPALKDLTFFMNSFNFMTSENGQRAFSSVICQWHTLRSLAVIDLTQEALKRLATIPFQDFPLPLSKVRRSVVINVFRSKPGIPLAGTLPFDSYRFHVVRWE